MGKLILGVAVVGLSCAAHAAWHWGFETGNEGWVVADLTTGGPYHPPVAIYSVSHSTSGGCQGGHIFRADPSNRTFSFSLPVNQLPEGHDWSGGRLDFCLRSTHQTWTQEPYVVFVGGDGTTLRAVIDLPDAAWSTYRVDLSPASLEDMGGGPADPAEFQAVMTQLEAVYIIAEYGAQVQETTGLDEVRLRAACPEALDEPVVQAVVAGPPEDPRVDLWWTAVPGAWGYRVWSKVGGSWSPVAETAGTTWSLEPGLDGTGLFRVRALCE
jgi:hypothetical protein